MGDKKRVTIAELAQELGYSKSTISRALSGKGRLSSETRENISPTVIFASWEEMIFR